MNELVKGVMAIILYFVLFGILAISLLTLNPFGILIGIFGLTGLWNKLNE